MPKYAPPLQLDLSMKHLQMMLMRIDLLLHRQVHRLQKANQKTAGVLTGQYISDAEVNALLQQSLGGHWRHLLAPEGKAETAAYERALRQTEQQIDDLLAGRPAGSPLPRLLRLARDFRLAPFEVDALLIVLAPALDLRYERIYGYLLDDATRKRPSVNLVLDVLCEPGPARLLLLPYLQDSASLCKHGFVEKVLEPGMVRPPLLNQALVPDPMLVQWLLGDFRPHADLAAHARLTRPAANESDLLLAATRLQELTQTSAVQPLLAFHGPDREAQRAAGRLLAAQLQRPLLTVDLKALIAAGLSPQRAVDLALRDANLAQALPYLENWDDCLEEDAPPPALLSALSDHPEVVILAGKKEWRPRAAARRREIAWISFPVPAYAERLSLWHHLLQSVHTDGALNLTKLAGQFMLTSGQVQDVVATARDTAVQHGRAVGNDDLFAAARAHSNSRLASLARKIAPRYDWNDLILPVDQVAILREIVSTVLSRPLVIEEWGVGKKLASSAGITVLFAGPPGTGKTMAAEVMAGELGLDLYKIDLSSVVSKYIGETEKNLEKIFNEAESSNAVLFFDEADSIFGKRSEVRDAHDRYANIEVSYLLQRMEAYNGITILATNLRANLDEAFMRRIQFAVDFPFPERGDRLRIWQTLMPGTVPQADDLDLERMARQFKMAGGNIRNIIVSATYLAAANGHQITMEYLLHGTRRELQKMGRLVNEEDLAIDGV